MADRLRMSSVKYNKDRLTAPTHAGLAHSILKKAILRINYLRFGVFRKLLTSMSEIIIHKNWKYSEIISKVLRIAFYYLGIF